MLHSWQPPHAPHLKSNFDQHNILSSLSCSRHKLYKYSDICACKSQFEAIRFDFAVSMSLRAGEKV
jgi:hypothetical protein